MYFCPLFHHPTIKVPHCHTDPLSRFLQSQFPMPNGLLPIPTVLLCHFLTAPLAHCALSHSYTILQPPCPTGPLSTVSLTICLTPLLSSCPDGISARCITAPLSKFPTFTLSHCLNALLLLPTVSLFIYHCLSALQSHCHTISLPAMSKPIVSLPTNPLSQCPTVSLPQCLTDQ
jgi:hypothetical protein